MEATEYVTAPEALPAIAAAHERLRAMWEPPPDILPSEWAEQNIWLRKGTTPRPGELRLETYQREIVDVFKDPNVTEIVFVKPTQVGWSLILNTITAYSICVDPRPLMIVQPTSDNAKDYGRKRINPLIQDCPELKKRIRQAKRTKGGNTLKLKEFPGGFLKLAGANVGTDLRSDMVEIVLMDEVEAYPDDVGGEGDPMEVAENRTETVNCPKILKGSTPAKPKGLSRLEKRWLASDQRRFYVTCPHCSLEQVLWWQDPQTKEYRLVYKVNEETGEVDPDSVEYVCAGCRRGIREKHKKAMLDRGRWIATYPERSVVGFHLNALYRPWKDSWAALAQKWVDAQGDVEKLKEFVTLQLGEFWEERGSSLDAQGLAARLEPYGGTTVERFSEFDVPNGAALLTCQADVQGNRIEASVKAWGPGEESWLVAYEIFWGDPSTDQDVWDQLEALRLREFVHESGIKLRPLITVIDSGDGDRNDAVYDFVLPRQTLRDRVFATKGVDMHAKPILVQEGSTKRHAIRLFTIATHAAKERIFSRLQLAVPTTDENGATKPYPPGFIHLPAWVTDEYLDQLTSEKKVRMRDKKRGGKVKTRWIKTHERNEALDCEVLSLAALFILQNYINPGLYRDLAKFREVLMSGQLQAATARTRRMRSEGVRR
jgi:phage terminase large subunit GpA-like protein